MALPTFFYYLKRLKVPTIYHPHSDFFQWNNSPFFLGGQEVPNLFILELYSTIISWALPQENLVEKESPGANSEENWKC